MELKDILVLMDKLPHAADRLDLSLVLAKQHGARIIGLNVVTHPLFEVKQSHGSDDESQLHDIFMQKTAQAGVSATWQNIDVKGLRSGVAEVVNHYANFADLVVLGQTDHGSRDKVVEADLPERVVLGSGKPVLIVPYTGSFSSVGDRVLVAWKSGRESSRALADALPLLKRADAVNVFEVNPTDGEKDDMERLCAHLERHDVPARMETSIVTELAVGDVLLNRLADEGSDLLVMGACAQTHFGASAIGEVARHVLRHMTVPVFMSH